MNIPTTHSGESLESFLQHIQDAPVPKNVSIAYLKRSGFTSGNHPELRHIFRILGFLNDKDQPKERWRLYKEQGQAVLREAVYECYKQLFELHPDAAHARSDTDLAGWFGPKTSGTRSSLERAIRTFRKLCQLAGITPDNRIKSALNDSQDKKEPFASVPQTTPKARQLILQLPALATEGDYVCLLKALKTVFYQ